MIRFVFIVFLLYRDFIGKLDLYLFYDYEGIYG